MAVSAGTGTTRATRTVVVRCPDWSVAAAGCPPDVPAAVLRAGRVVTVSAAARADGVRRGHRRREAQARCPELTVLRHDPDRDAREFEPVVAVVEALAPGVAVVEPGLLALRARGPARYFGGDEQVTEILAAEVSIRLRGLAPAQVGVADGLFAAVLAARAGGVVVPPGESPQFLDPHSVATLTLDGVAGNGPDREALVDLLRRLGLHTLGAFAAVPASDVASRFDTGALLAHRLARGLDPQPVTGRAVPLDLEVELELDPPAEQVEPAGFAARALIEQLQDRLTRHGLGCTRLTVGARTASGEECARTWRSDGVLTAAAIIDRVRWQLDGWLTGRARARPTAGVTQLRLVADEVTAQPGRQLTLWGGWDESAALAQRGLARVQGMLGPEAVLVPVVGGGRGPAERVRLVPWQDEAAPAHPPDAPWPGRLPAPHPTRVLPAPEPVRVLDHRGAAVVVSDRQQLSGAPAVLRRNGRNRPVLVWAGPWTVDERWWNGNGGRRTRLQVIVASSTAQVPDRATPAPRAPGASADPSLPTEALLLVTTDAGWAVEGTYG